MMKKYIYIIAILIIFIILFIINAIADKKQLDYYIEKMKTEFDIEYVDLGEYYYHDGSFDETYDPKNPMVTSIQTMLLPKISANK